MKRSHLPKQINPVNQYFTFELSNSWDRVKAPLAQHHKHHVPLMSSLRISAEVLPLIKSLKCDKLMTKLKVWWRSTASDNLMKLKAQLLATRLMNLKQLSVTPPRLRLLKANQLRRERLRRLKNRSRPPRKRRTKSSVRWCKFEKILPIKSWSLIKNLNFWLGPRPATSASSRAARKQPQRRT